MKNDIHRWNAKYEGRIAPTQVVPDPVLTEYEHLIPHAGSALDLASGLCDNALFLAARGCDSFAVDGSELAIRQGLDRAAVSGLRVYAFVADLDNYPLPTDAFDVIVSIRYLNRDLIPALKGALKRGGLMVVKTFNTNFVQQKPDFPQGYALAHGELAGWFDGWTCLGTNDGDDNEQTQSFWIGTKSTA